MLFVIPAAYINQFLFSGMFVIPAGFSGMFSLEVQCKKIPKRHYVIFVDGWPVEGSYNDEADGTETLTVNDVSMKTGTLECILIRVTGVFAE